MRYVEPSHILVDPPLLNVLNDAAEHYHSLCTMPLPRISVEGLHSYSSQTITIN